MLALKNIIKDYVCGDNITHALKGVSVNFRKNEFVSILGPSGCGKTTLLNIIGGLDRYTDGDLLIAGKSTKEYKDRDWDTYRNHSIGFVFQTYNLISHQNILKNVELALTISGVSKEERKERAYNALKLVGLEGMEKKKPNQLSGGQCQRVAIARALINNPEILLADEPTGALDSETSVQIMNLLKEVASDRLVIMVTHNPDLAYRYSTRIINMSDGLLLNDSNPFEYDLSKETVPESNEIKGTEISKGKKKKTSMSILTSIGLSTSNLLSKMKRTVLVTIAGSIGIIGVSAVLAASRGVKDYIKDLQNDMLSSYPITIAEESVDYTSLISGLGKNGKKEKFQFDVNDPKIGVDSMISYLMDAYSDLTNVKTNTIDERILDFVGNQMPMDDVGAITYDYGIDPTNNIFGRWTDEKTSTSDYYSFNGLTQRYISELNSVEGFSGYASFVDLFTGFMHELPDNRDYILDQYDVISGDYTTNTNDLVLVVDKDTTLTDFLLAQLGIFNHDSFINVALCAMKEQELKKSDGFDKKTQAEKDAAIKEVRDTYPYERDFTFDDVRNRDFYYFPQDTIYSSSPKVIDDTKKTVDLNFIYTDGGSDFEAINLASQRYMNSYMLVGSRIQKTGADFNTENVVCFNLSAVGNSDYYPSQASDLSGIWVAFNRETLIEHINEIRSASLDNPASLITLAGLASFVVQLDSFTYEGGNDYSFDSEYYPVVSFPLDTGVKKDVTSNVRINDDPVTGFSYSANANNDWLTNPGSVNGSKMRISSILRLKDQNNFGSLSRGLYYTKSFSDKYINDSKEGRVTENLKQHIQNLSLHSYEYKNAYVEYNYYDYKHEEVRHSYASTLNSNLNDSISDLFSGLTGVNYAETNAKHLRSLCGYKAININNDKGLFKEAEFKLFPKQISIYPKSFEGKDSITKHLDRWNSDEVLTLNNVPTEKKDRDDLTYTDTIALIVSVIDTFIDAITVALVVFTSLSLVVSCFMIAVITYISVVERIKEIGVIRSLGGRKGDVATLFIMETLMTGLFSGVFGVTITYILQIIVNIILKAVFGIAIIHLTIPTALLMIAISVALSVLSGLIPSQSAAHKDPVVALRSNE